MKRVKFILTTLLLAPLVPTYGADVPSRPNVLFVLCDDIYWNVMSCAGHQ
ncbi:MAG: hypothetical protein ABSG53_14430 [Thermoguttaceae bacterium]|jgi:hypothetical protein